jgi:hypothetical protein
MEGQNVIAFRSPDDEDTLILTSIFNRQREVDELVDAGAQVLYRARAVWVGGVLLPWGMLSAWARESYRREVEQLVKKAKGEQ